jgi:hypothetical protein
VLRSGSSSAERNVSANGPVNEFWAHHDLDRCTSLEQSFMSNVDLALSVMPGIGLAAATGFRVFLPMLIVNAAAYRGISSATRFRMRWRLTGRLGRADSNLCISEFEPGPAQHQKRDTKKGPRRQTVESPRPSPVSGDGDQVLIDETTPFRGISSVTRFRMR